MAGRRYDLARVAWAKGDYDQAEKFYEETLAFIQREMQNRGAMAGILFELGEVAWAKGDLGLATRRYEESQKMAQEIGANYTRAAAINGLGRVASSLGEFEKASSLHKEALAILRGSGHRWGALFSLAAFTMLTARRQNMQAAATLYGAMASFYPQI